MKNIKLHLLLISIAVLSRNFLFADRYDVEIETLKTKDIVGDVFEQLYAEGTNAVFTLRSSGTRFVYTLNSRQPKQTEYSEKINIPFGADFEIYEKHLRVTFSPLPDEYKHAGFDVLYTFDALPFGYDFTKKAGYLVFPDRLANPTSTNRSDHVIIVEASTNKLNQIKEQLKNENR